jgi:hypothetical protein
MLAGMWRVVDGPAVTDIQGNSIRARASALVRMRSPVRTLSPSFTGRQPPGLGTDSRSTTRST